MPAILTTEGDRAGEVMTWAWLTSWWHRPRLAHVQLVMYTRRGCHLCEAAWERLEEAQRRHGFALSAVDVDDDPELAARYGHEVPVVTVDGVVRFRGTVNAVLLDRLLRHAAR